VSAQGGRDVEISSSARPPAALIGSILGEASLTHLETNLERCLAILFAELSGWL